MGINFIKQYSQAGLMDKFPLLSSFTIDDITIPALRDAAVGSMVSTHWVSGATDQRSVEFIEAFKNKYGRTPSSYAMQGYDAAVLIDESIKNNPDAAKDKEALMKAMRARSEEHTSELQSRENLVCRLLLEKKNKTIKEIHET